MIQSFILSSFIASGLYVPARFRLITNIPRTAICHAAHETEHAIVTT